MTDCARPEAEDLTLENALGYLILPTVTMWLRDLKDAYDLCLDTEHGQPFCHDRRLSTVLLGLVGIATRP